MPYPNQVSVGSFQEWLALREFGVVIDPLILRAGHLFLQGPSEDPASDVRKWQAIESDIGALVKFFDLVVLRDQLPAFNYYDTFNALCYGPYDSAFGGGARIEELLNTSGDVALVHVLMEHDVYKAVKEAAIYQLRTRLGTVQPGASLVTPQARAEILFALDSIQYVWEPSLQGLEAEFPAGEDQRLVRFLLGQLVFTGYAQPLGSQHELAPKQSRLLAAVGVDSAHAAPSAERELYDELRRRIRDAGSGWRDEDLPWTPSFLPFLLGRMNRYREGPDTLLNLAKDLRDSKAIESYRALRSDLTGEDESRSAEARERLSGAADAVANQLDSTRDELESFANRIVTVLPRAVGVVGGGLAGSLAVGADGAVIGGLTGLVGEEVLKVAQNMLWGWYLDRLPLRSGTKLLTRSVKAEYKMRDELVPQLHAVWERKAGR